jgi:hypothetical protein
MLDLVRAKPELVSQFSSANQIDGLVAVRARSRLAIHTGRAPGERVRVGPKRSYRALVGDYDSPLEPKPAKPKPAPKKDAA